MLTIENGRFSDCTFLEDIVNKKITVNKYKNRILDRRGRICFTQRNKDGSISITVNFEEESHFNDNIIRSLFSTYSLHNIENANIF